MSKTESRKLKDLCKKKMMVTCVLMGLSFRRYAEVYSVDGKDVCDMFWRVLFSLGWEGTLMEVREHKLRIIYDLGNLNMADLNKKKTKNE